MCGIAGAYFWNGVTAAGAESCVNRMKDALRHRGPDGEGVWSTETADGGAVALAHTRLAIIDRSAEAAQPMNSLGCPSWIVYNGETYNFASLRDELQTPGAPFRSRSDTEVVLRAYQRWGLASFERLRGMFAFGLWDATNARLVLARDRLGIKPLYYFVGDRFVLFASEVRALLASGLVPRVLDREGLWHYLGYQSLPAPRTLVEGVRMLAPATWLAVDRRGETTSGQYWNLLNAADANRDDAGADESRARLRALLRDAVASHLVSDVPVAAFLSGGIDSSAVVALMREAGTVPRTFCIGFREQAFDEGTYAREVAAAFGCEHTDIVLEENDLLRLLPEALAAMDQPSGDGVNSYVIARAVRSRGIAVALSGLGGDEFFGGYPSFARLERLVGPARVWGRSPAAVRRAAASVVRTLGRGAITASKAAAAIESDGSLTSLFPITRQILSPAQRCRLLPPSWAALAALADPYAGRLAEAFERSHDTGVLARVSFAEAGTYMHDVLLRDADQMSMAHALEVRVPLLDHLLVEHVMALPDERKRPGKLPKRLLVENLGVGLPPAIINRPKRGFTLPFDVWMRGRLRAFCEHRLGPERLERRGLFRVNALRQLWSAFLAGSRQVSWSRVWILVALDDWLERTQVQAAD